ncbi:thiosulfate oxidation carrier complex protein SoxZ [Benzoatithermus flavus]|uniref:Thiosulfate oxidation carrier complex protein SoxZ n=1 Tax=Benzoatithermus flavus TaxID=3108223 RepID=A0ABU8XUR9_9PROT
MADTGKPRLKLPESVKAGEPFAIKTLISHPMESGQRKDAQGNPIPRRIINRFTCTAGDREVFAVDLHPAIAANPYLAFWCRLDRPTELVFTWIDDGGETWTARQQVEVVPA